MTKRRLLGFVFLALAIACFTWSSRQLPPAPKRSLAERLLGPIAEIAAAVQWVRADAAWANGRIDLYDARAELALRLAPGDPNGWIYYAHHLVFDRASPTRGQLHREHWIQAGLDVLERGERESRSPGRLAFQSAIVFVVLAQMDDADRPLGLTRAEAWTHAADAFERAARAGEPLAQDAADEARKEAERAKQNDAK